MSGANVLSQAIYTLKRVVLISFMLSFLSSSLCQRAYVSMLSQQYVCSYLCWSGSNLRYAYLLSCVSRPSLLKQVYIASLP